MERSAREVMEQALEALTTQRKEEQAILAARSDNEAIYNLRKLCSDQALEINRLKTQILSLTSKSAYLEVQLDKARPPAIRPDNAISVSVNA